MLQSIDDETRFNMKVPDELIEPIRVLVQTALEKSRDGEIDSLGRQGKDLIDPVTGVTFHIRNLHPEAGQSETPWAYSSGLFLSIDEVASNGVVMHRTQSIQAPADPQAITADNIFTLRGLIPESVDETNQALQRALPITIIDGQVCQDLTIQGLLPSGL